MAEEPQRTTRPALREENRGAPTGVIAGAVFMAVVLAGMYFVAEQQSRQEAPSAPSQEAENYLANLAMADLRLSAEENFLGQQVTYLDGTLSNQGERTIQQLKLRLYFRDTLNQVVLREDRDLIGPRSATLPPGETLEFRLNFGNIPNSWNRQVPQFQLVAMEFQ